jgi:hypothetical protein
MFPLLLASPIFSAVGTIASGSMSLAGKAVSTAVKAASASEKISEDVEKVVDKQGKEHDANSPTGRMVVNMTKDEEPKEMFGGMDLGKIKSALDEDSPLGMPDEVKGGVYKQIFEVNKMMLGSLQRMEKTMKLLLEVEYERIKGMVSQERRETITEGDTDNKVGESGGNRFGDRLKSGAKSVGGMLGSAYGKVKGGLTGTFGKLLGLGALIFAFKNYKEEIINAMAKVLEFFKGVYEYFTADDFTFAKFKDDWKTKFMPKIQELIFSMLDTIWSTVKDVAMSWLFGASGDTRIQQESGTGMTAKKNITDMNINTADIKDATFNKQGNIKSSTTTLDDETSTALNTQIQSQLKAMQEISAQSDGRIQWQGINRDMSGWTNGDSLLTEYSVLDVINANPVIDGVKYPSWDILKTINLQQMGGMTNLMTEDKQEEITKILAEKSVLANEFSAVESSEYGDMGFFSKLVRNPADFPKLKKNRLAAIQKEIDAQDLLLSQSGAGELKMNPDPQGFQTTFESTAPDTTKIPPRTDGTANGGGAVVVSSSDNSSKTNVSNTNNLSSRLDSKNNMPTAQLMLHKAVLGTT